MGKVRTKLIGIEEIEKEQKEKAKIRREQKKKREAKKIRPVGGKGGERMRQVEVSEKELEKMEEAKKILEKKKAAPSRPRLVKKKVRGKNYQKAKKKIDKNKKYSLKEAISLIKKISFARFDETVELHLNVKEKGLKGEVSFPHGTGKKIRVAVVDDKLLSEIEKGNLNFDVLICHPSFMPKLVKLAKILGPKGLMPNLKAGTISDKPEAAAKKFAGGVVRFKTEPRFPIIHQPVGKISFSSQALEENISTFINAIGKSKVKSGFLKSSMGPSVRLDMEKI